jgi:uncharacterized membrane protein
MKAFRYLVFVNLLSDFYTGNMKTLNIISRIHKTPAHVRLWIAIAIALLVYLLSQHAPPGIQFILVWSSFTTTILVLLWTTILTAKPNEVRLIAKKQDSSRTIIFIFVLFASIVSLFAVIFLLRILPDTKQSGYYFHVGFSICSVALSWILIHTIFAIRYTHLYYTYKKEKKDNDIDHGGGFLFTTSDEPDYFDFTYFSFVIGMTFQVSDIQITSKHVRRIVLVHALISFVYNTVILALTINIISGLIQK